MNQLISVQENSPNVLNLIPSSDYTKKETNEGITESNHDQGSYEGPQMHPRVGMKS